MRRFLPLLLVPMVACGVSEEKFTERFSESACETFFSCADGGSDSGGAFFFFTNEEECVDFYELIFALGTSGCDYDKKAGKECLDAIESASCEEIMSDDLPSACEDVYSGDTCGWGGSGGDTGF